MKRIITITTVVILAAVIGCGGETITLTPEKCEKMGRQVPNGEIPTPADLALDAYCAKLVQERSAPEGFITIFGSARAKEGMASYDQTRAFAKAWTEKFGKTWPILTGGGPGIMEAGNRGALEAKGKSLYYSSYFGSGNEPKNKYTTDGYVFASFSQREAEMVDRAAAVLVAPGGFGTEWEIYETLAKIQTKKKTKMPVVLLGGKKVWGTLLARIAHLKKIKTISAHDPDYITVAETPEEAIKIMARALVKN